MSSGREGIGRWAGRSHRCVTKRHRTCFPSARRAVQAPAGTHRVSPQQRHARRRERVGPLLGNGLFGPQKQQAHHRGAKHLPKAQDTCAGSPSGWLASARKGEAGGAGMDTVRRAPSSLA